MDALEEVATPGMKTIEQVSDFLNVPTHRLIKTLVFSVDENVIAVLLRGDHDVNVAKLKNLLGAQTVELASPELVSEITNAPMGFAGPQGLEVELVADHAIKEMRNAVTGGNKQDVHMINVNVGRDFSVNRYADIRLITPEDRCPRCGETMVFGRGIEVGHIFKLGTKYSDKLRAFFLDEQGKELPIVMGCYGIGVGRTVAAAVEQSHDEKGIIFPIPIAPFEVVVLELQPHEPSVVQVAEGIYRGLQSRNIEVLLDDRDERAGVKFNDADLIGIPIRITVGQRGIKQGSVEVKLRNEPESINIPHHDAEMMVAGKVKKLYDSLK
jgi:prolyl-tRNA synthetase